MASQKEQAAYNMGMAHALQVVKEGGAKALEEECKYRNIHELPLNVSLGDITRAVRKTEFMQRELITQAVALAWAVQVDMKLPPSTVGKMLAAYNAAVDAIRYDDEELSRRSKQLDRHSKMAAICKEWIENYSKRLQEEEND